MDAAKEQPIPNGKGVDIATLVHKDLEDRIESGRIKCGQRLQADNGRDALLDAYQKAIDLVVYLRQAIWKRDDKRSDDPRH